MYHEYTEYANWLNASRRDALTGLGGWPPNQNTQGTTEAKEKAAGAKDANEKKGGEIAEKAVECTGIKRLTRPKATVQPKQTL